MAFEWASIVGASTGGGLLGFVAATFSREAKFNARLDVRLKHLEKEVEECRNERPQIAIIKMGACMMAEEMNRRLPGNPILRQVATAFDALPREPDDTLDKLMQKLNEIPGTKELQDDGSDQ